MTDGKGYGLIVDVIFDRKKGRTICASLQHYPLSWVSDTLKVKEEGFEPDYSDAG